MSVAIAPSILAADFMRLGEAVREVEQAGADRIHIDVMDGHFVPNLSMGPAIVASMRKATRLPLEVHLMVMQPTDFLEPFRRAGADTLIVHLEVAPDPWPVVAEIRRIGARAGLAIKPDTPVDRIEPFLTEVDVALCMTVFPGFSGQSFLPDSPERIHRLRELIERVNPKCELEVDGGIDPKTGAEAVKSGANVLVAAKAIFQSADSPSAAMAALRALAPSFVPH